MPMATTSECPTLPRARAWPTTSRVFVQISSASCSTHPARGKICWCSFCPTETTAPSWSKIMQRVLVVPWSMAATYWLTGGSSRFVAVGFGELRSEGDAGQQAAQDGPDERAELAGRVPEAQDDVDEDERADDLGDHVVRGALDGRPGGEGPEHRLGRRVVVRAVGQPGDDGAEEGADQLSDDVDEGRRQGDRPVRGVLVRGAARTTAGAVTLFTQVEAGQRVLYDHVAQPGPCQGRSPQAMLSCTARS